MSCDPGTGQHNSLILGLWSQNPSRMLLGVGAKCGGGRGANPYFSAKLRFPFGLAACF